MNYWASCSMLQTVHEATKENHDEFLIKEVIIDERQQQNRNKQTVAFAVIRLNGKRVKAKLDTGAEVNIMPLRVLSQIADQKTKIKTRKAEFNGYSGETFQLRVQSKYNAASKTSIYQLIFTLQSPSAKP